MVKAALCASVLALGAGGCKHDGDGAEVAGWTLVDPVERHPIIVSQEPEHFNISVAKGAGGLTPSQRAELLSFAGRSRASDAGNTKLIIAVPSGSANEVAAMRAVHEIRYLLDENGFPETSIMIEAYAGEGSASPPIKLSYMRYVAEGPECNKWTTNLAREPQNLPYPNLGCATQKNLAAMVANPADLLGPRSETARPAERRLVTWEKFVKGDTTGAKKSKDEQISTDGGS
jgi:pilus assembly protein CpaD